LSQDLWLWDIYYSRDYFVELRSRLSKIKNKTFMDEQEVTPSAGSVDVKEEDAEEIAPTEKTGE